MLNGVNGVNGNDPVDGKSYTKQPLNSQSGTRKVSIFNEIGSEPEKN